MDGIIFPKCSSQTKISRIELYFNRDLTVALTDVRSKLAILPQKLITPNMLITSVIGNITSARHEFHSKLLQNT